MNGGAMAIISRIIEHNKFTPDDVPKLEGKLFWEGNKRRILPIDSML